MKNILISSRFISYFLRLHFLLTYSIILIPAIIFILLSSCTDQEENVLAIVENRTITMTDFVNRYKSVRQKMNLPDNGQVRKEIFRNMVNEELLIVEAMRRGYDRDSEGHHEYQRIKIQELLNAYLQEKVFKHIKIQEEELEKLYIRMNTKIKARHLYASSKKQADSLYRKLMQGYTFEELAKEIFNDPQLRDTGGSLGYFTVDEMDPGFEDVAFSLSNGQISKPVRTAQGYSIIQVQDKITKPLLRTSEYQKHKSKLKTYWLYRMKKRATQAFSDSIRKELDISFNDTVIRELFNLINSSRSDFTSIDIENSLEGDPLKNKEIVTSKLGIWNIKTLQENAIFSSEEQKKWIRNTENLEDFISGLVIRNYILSEAHKMNLQNSSNYESIIQQKMDECLIKRMENSIAENIMIPEDTLLIYYQDHREQFVIPPRIQLSEIVLDSETKIKEVEKLLQKNKSFENLAQIYSVQRRSAEENGNIGTFTSQELGSYADRLMPLEIGQWTGPIKIDNQFVFFKCLNKLPTKKQTYEEARPLIQNTLRPYWQNITKQIVLKEIRSSINLVTYPEKLKLIHLN